MSKFSPAGSAGEIDQEVAVPPPPTDGVTAVMGVPLVNVSEGEG